MGHRFSLLLNLKTPAGFVVFGEFSIGDDPEAAHHLFDSLQGDESLSDQILYIDLMETTEPLPEKVRMKGCRLDELATNCKLITRAVFCQKNLKAYEE
ncbi:hypothetical protein [Mucilaginibacter agri]|uniref:Uncharacterized protein n=1 Tax=Mucilaginibacter agri TaxID=2695265 RepID=A0A965ZC28_9SPHI|nr:hypothetical protein [Mucilaginibacter agri]NCD68268.1 hypothetical protein [Mucilaginibacter agri]